jgi:ATP/maltotriose-dependent transcriptional regulator MalT
MTQADEDAVRGDDALASARAACARHDWDIALEAARAAPVTGGAEEADRLDLEAEAAWWLGRLDECITAREAAYRAYEELGDRRRAGQCAVWLWEHHALNARPAIAGGWLRRARRSLEAERECDAYGNLLLREAETAHGAGELDQAIALASEALDLARSLPSTDLEAEALQTRGRIRIDLGRIDEGMGDLDEAMLFAVEGRLGPFSTGKVYCSLIGACEDVGDYNRAAEWTEATQRWAEAHPFAIFPGVCRVHRALILKRAGALEEAEKEAARACDELRQSHVPNSAAALAEVGDIRRRLGDLERAEEAFARFQEAGGGTCGGLALLRLAQGRVQEAVEIATTCVASQANPLARAGVLPVLAQVAIAAGDLGVAQRALDELASTTERIGTTELHAAERSTRGRLQLAEGAPAAAATLREAAEAWRTLGVPYEEATARTLVGQAERVAGDEAAAAASFETAVALFDQIGARLESRLVLDDAKAELPAGLTEREVEVLRLIAAGMTNNEIAAELFLSAKTVSRHLSNIFTKIGVSTRAAATAYAFEHDLVRLRR